MKIDVEQVSHITKFLKVAFGTFVVALSVKAAGFSKDLTIAYFFGASKNLDNFLLLFLAVTFFVTPVAGAASTALTPLLTEIKFEKGWNGATNFLRSIMLSCLTYTVSFMLLVSVVIAVSTYFVNFDYQIFSSKSLFFLIFIPLFSCISIVSGGILIAEKRAKQYALSPIFVSIITILCLWSFPGLEALDKLILGTCLGYFCETLYYVIMTKNSFFVARKKQPWTNSYLKKTKEQMPFLVFSTMILNCTLIVDQLMASFAGNGAVSMVMFGNKIPSAVISLLSVIWVILYPIFSTLIIEKKFNDLKRYFILICTFVLLVGIILTNAVAYFSYEIIEKLFARGAFELSTAILVGEIQYYYILHIPFYVVCIICSRLSSSFKRNDLLLILSVTSLCLNAILNLIFLDVFGVVGISIATLSSYVTLTILWIVTAKVLIQREECK